MLKVLVRGSAFLVTFTLAVTLSGCASDDKLVAPVPLNSPFVGERVWAVAPLMNQSGVSTIDVLHMSDAFVIEVDGVQGISCLPLNRTLAAMQGLGLEQISTDADARALMRVLQVEGLFVGTITAYSPYQPLKLGIAAQAYTNDRAAATTASVTELTMSMGDSGAASAPGTNRMGPSSQTSRVYDANNHDVLMRLGQYAAGRSDPKSGLRQQIYVTTMDAYTRFVAFDVVGSLLASEASQQAPRPDAESK